MDTHTDFEIIVHQPPIVSTNYALPSAVMMCTYTRTSITLNTSSTALHCIAAAVALSAHLLLPAVDRAVAQSTTVSTETDCTSNTVVLLCTGKTPP